MIQLIFMEDCKRLPFPILSTVERLQEMELKPYGLVFPTPLLKMPHELHLDSTPDYVQKDGAWTRVSLPIYCRAEVLPLGPDTECFLIATQNCRGWGQGGDGLTVSSGVNRTDFTFRSGVFQGFPRGVTRQGSPMLRSSEWNELSMVLSESLASYWINGMLVASCKLEPGEVPAAELYLGLTSYSTGYRIRGFDVSRDPAVLQRVCTLEAMRTLGVFMEKVVTLTAQWDDVDSLDLCISCANLAGEHLAKFQAVQGNTPLQSFRRLLMRELKLTRHHDVRLVLQDGTLLTEGQDEKPLCTVLAQELELKQ